MEDGTQPRKITKQREMPIAPCPKTINQPKYLLPRKKCIPKAIMRSRKS